MKVFEVSSDKAARLLNLSTKWRWMVNLMSWSLYLI